MLWVFCSNLLFLTCEKQHHSQKECEDFTDLLHYLVTDSSNSKLVTKYQQDRPLYFDYAMVSEKYGISLESFTGEQEEDKQEAQQQDLPF